MAYHVSLSMFDGPLDLLLHLIARAQVDIRDIFISEITDQFLDYMAGLDELDMDRASEFLEMAARLLEIKSRRLLPGPPVETVEEEDPEEALIRQLEEYKLFKAAGAVLQQKEKQAANMYFRLPFENVKGADFDITNASVELLREAFAILMARLKEDEEEKPERQIEREIFTVQEQIFRIQSILGQRKGPVGFHELFSERPGREEVITAFVALLELLKLNRISIKQDGLFGKMAIEARVKRDTEAEYGEA
jgi:segregation and condensation protein A